MKDQTVYRKAVNVWCLAQRCAAVCLVLFPWSEILYFVCVVCVCSLGGQNVSNSLELRVVDSHLMYWESNLGPLKKQYALLSTEPSLRSPGMVGI